SAGRRTLGMRSTCPVRENLFLPEDRRGPLQFKRQLIDYFRTMLTGRVMRSTDKFSLFSRSACTPAGSDVDR
ncbi:hypothetical protein A2U01_0097681, partial [Trifolium medium]|nr:hypothetical protein [Trifolium medium]